MKEAESTGWDSNPRRRITGAKKPENGLEPPRKRPYFPGNPLQSRPEPGQNEIRSGLEHNGLPNRRRPRPDGSRPVARFPSSPP
jgi:hypothetical protein